MPIYNYKCKACEHEFSELLKMDDRNIPVETPCPECEEKEIYLVIGSPKIVAGVGTNIGKAPQGFKDLLGRIKKGSDKQNTVKT